MPFYWWPKFCKTKSRHVLSNARKSPKLSMILDWIDGQILLRNIMGFWFKITQIVFVLVAMGFWLGNWVTYLDVVMKGPDINMFAYKVVYYTPILSRLLIVALSVIGWSNMNDRTWEIYDTNDIISIEEKKQLSIMICVTIVMIPDSFLNLVEFLGIVEFWRSGNIVATQTYNPNSPEPTLSIYLAYYFLAFFTIANLILRYSPLLNITFASICVKNHLKLINSQLDRSNRNKKKKNEAIHDNSKRRKQSNDQDGVKNDLMLNVMNGVNQVESFQDPHTQDEYTTNEWQQVSDTQWSTEGNDLPKHGYTYGDMQDSMRRFREKTSVKVISDRQNGRSKSILSAKHTINLLNLNTSKVEMNSDCQRYTADEERYCVISNLFQLEQHLTQLMLFVSDLDRQSPSSIVITCIINVSTFVMSFFYIRIAPRESVDLVLAFLFLFARLLPVITIMVVGNSLERQGRELSNRLEAIYLRGSSHSLIYKQLGGSVHSLERIFFTLRLIRFNCDKIMSLNFKTLGRITIYASTAILLVIQYDTAIR